MRKFQEHLKIERQHSYYGVSHPQIKKWPISLEVWTKSAIKLSLNVLTPLRKFVSNILWRIMDITINLLIKQDISDWHQHPLNDNSQFSSKTNYIFLSTKNCPELLLRPFRFPTICNIKIQVSWSNI